MENSEKVIFQDNNYEKIASELAIANKKLAIQNQEMEKRAAELIIANKELIFQNEEKEKRAAELIIANKELVFQNEEKEKRAAELIIANEELIFQNEEKEKRARELSVANHDLISFTYVSSHDLQEPLRKIQNFVLRIVTEEEKNLSEKGKSYFTRISKIAERMQDLIEDLLTYSRTKSTEHEFIEVDLSELVADVLNDFEDVIKAKQAKISVSGMGTIKIIPFQIRQLFLNIIGNSFKFSKENVPAEISITGSISLGSELNYDKLQSDKKYMHVVISDNGIGFDTQYKNKIFEVFQRLHSFEEYHGTGIGLAICKRIVENHQGFIMADGHLNIGASVDFYLLAN
jgi:light-regulated signal transduction histidine kinase (bacteriophytochrome)